MAVRGRRAWLSVLLGLVLGFVLASRLVLPRASELKRAGPRRRASPEGCRPGQAAAAAASQAGGARGDARGAQLWPHGPASDGGPRDRNFLFVGVMTAQKYLQTRAVAAYRERRQEREHKQEEWEREKQASCQAESPMRGLIPGAWDHDLS